MKKNFLGGIAVIVVVTVAAFNVNLNSQKKNISLLSLANIEALANENGNDDRSRCSVEWTATVGGHSVVLSCSADCPSGQRAECKQNNCKCVSV